MNSNENEPYRPVIRSQADLEEVWRHLMGPQEYTAHAVWCLFIDPDHRPIPQLVEIGETAEVPDEEERRRFTDFLAHFGGDLGPGEVRIAFLIARPGPGVLRAHDRGWAAALYDVTHRAGLGCETVHLATDRGIRPLPLDELDVAS